jgi:hypothetical protein
LEKHGISQIDGEWRIRKHGNELRVENDSWASGKKRDISVDPSWSCRLDAYDLEGLFAVTWGDGEARRSVGTETSRRAKTEEAGRLFI